MNNKISVSQATMWISTAAVAVLLSLGSKDSYLSVLLAVAVCGIVSYLAIIYGKGELPRWLAVLELGWLVVFLAGIGRESETCWESQPSIPIIPIALLALSAWGAQDGAQRAARTSATLAWLVIPVCALVLLAGIENIHLQWIDNQIRVPNGLIVAVLLTPCLGLFLPVNQTEKLTRMIPIMGIIAVLSAVWIDASMGASVARETANGFYEYSKGITLLNVAERFEAIIACILTGGWFALFTIVFSAVFHLGERLIGGFGKSAVWCSCLTAVLVMCILHISPKFLAVGNLIFWGFIPLLSQGLEAAKKVGKN